MNDALPYRNLCSGNHEFYGGSISGTVDALRQQCAGTQIHVLDNDEVIIRGVRLSAERRCGRISCCSAKARSRRRRYRKRSA